MTEANVKKTETAYIVTKTVNIEIVCNNADEIVEAFSNIDEIVRLIPNGTEQE